MYKIKIIDSLVIVVAEGTILNLDTSNLPMGVINEIKEVVDKLNLGLFTDQESHYKLRLRLFNLMKESSMEDKVKLLEKEEATIEETLALAEEGIDLEIRQQVGDRIQAIDDRFEHDGIGYVYLKGYSIPVPQGLIDAILDATYNPNSPYSIDALINFWKWAILNPNSEARNDLFGWFKTGEFAITDEGMVIAYRCVEIKQRGINKKLADYVNTEYAKIKGWKKSPKNYAVIQEAGQLYLTVETRKNPEAVDHKGFLGSLSDLYSDINTMEEGTVYTDRYTRTFEIRIGEEVSMDRNDCDEDRDASCSRGLHFMSTKYNLRLGNIKLVVLINPMNIVAFPRYDNTKGRSCAYLPVGLAQVDEEGEIIELGNGTFSFEYAQAGKKQLEELLAEKGLEEMIEDGDIAEISVKDFELSQDDIKVITSKKVITVLD